MHPKSASSFARNLRRGRLLTPVLALALAGCNWFQPAQPTMQLGIAGGEAAPVPLPAIKTGPRGGSGEGYFTLALPIEPDLPKATVKVTGGKAGQMNTKLANEATPVVVNVIPNGNGFIIEGAKLNKAGLKFYIGATEMAVVKKAAHQVVLRLPATFKGSSGIITVKDGTTQVVRTSADAKNVYVAGRVVVRFKEGAPRATIEAALLAAGVTYYRYPGMNYVVAYHAPDVTFDQMRTKLQAASVFEAVTRDTIYYGKAVYPTDPRYGEQWPLPKINAPAGWPYSAGSPDVVVAVLDTGVNLSHPDLAVNVFKNIDEIAGNNKDDDNNGRVDDVAGWNSYDQTGLTEDDNGHGTEMAGIVAANQDNVGIVGLAYDSRILPCKVSNAEGLATSSTVIDGINYAVRNRASVINMSLASNIDDSAVKDAIEFATTFNVTVVCAMGNDGSYIKQYPAAWSKDLPIISVGATNKVDARPAWGTYGEWMTVCAPGDQVLTTTLKGGYTVASGTSHAAAHVSGLAALIKALKPGWTPVMVRDLIVKTAIDRGAPGFDQYYGNGRITLDTTALGNLLQQVLGNLAFDASSEHHAGETPAELAGDKNSEFIWSSRRSRENEQQWLRIDLGKQARISSVAALSSPYYAQLFPRDFTIEVSDDELTWRQVAAETDFRTSESTWTRWNIAPTFCHYVRFNITRANQNPDNALYYAQIAEVAFNGEEDAIVKNSSTSYYAHHYASTNLRDGDPETYWISAPSSKPRAEYVIVDLGASRAFNTVRLLSPPRIISEAFPKSVALWVSNDKVNWRHLRDVTNLTATPATWYNLTVPAATGRYVRIDATETNAAESHGSLYSGRQLSGYAAALAEVEVQ